MWLIRHIIIPSDIYRNIKISYWHVNLNNKLAMKQEVKRYTIHFL